MEDFWDNLDGEITPPELSVPLCLRGDLVASINALQNELQDALARDKAEAATRGAGEKSAGEALLDRKTELEAEARRQSHEFVFRGLGDKKWRDLIAQHPPTKEQRRDFDVDHNPETFPTAAVAASLVKVVAPDGGETAGATEANIRGLRNRLTLGQWSQLWNACLGVNTGATNLGKSVSSTETAPASGPNSTTAAPEGSPAASSSAE